MGVSTVPPHPLMRRERAAGSLDHPSDDREELCNHRRDARKMEGRGRNVTDGCPDDQGWSSSSHHHPPIGVMDLNLVGLVRTRDSRAKR